MDKGQHRSYEGAAGTARLLVRLVARDSHLRSGVLQMDSMDFPPIVPRRNGVSARGKGTECIETKTASCYLNSALHAGIGELGSSR